MTKLPGKLLRIALVFPPAMPPTSPPLGIAGLKSYLEAEANVEVRNFDLNLAYFQQAFGWIDDRRIRMRIKKMDIETTAGKVVAARSSFLGKEGLSRFFDLTDYNEHAGTYAAFSSVFNGLFDSFARRVLVGLPIPPLAGRFFDELIEPVRAFRPDLVGFSILFSQQLFFALALAKLCAAPPTWSGHALAGSPRALGEAPQIVFGGATFSVMPDPGRLLTGPVPVYLGDEPREVNIGQLIDYLIVGEGERGLEALARRAARGQAAVAGSQAYGIAAGERNDADESIPGLLHIKNGKAVRNPAEAALDLNALSLPDFSDFPLDRYHSPVPVLPYLSSRGCPWRRCAFCTHQKTYLNYREEDAATTAERLSALQEKYGVSHFCLIDEMVHPRRLGQIAAHIIRKDVQVYFAAYAKPSGFSPEVLERAHRAGLRLMMWGLESSSQRILDLMCKGTDANKMATILESSSKAGVWNLLFLIFGFPTETREEWVSTLDFVESLGSSVHALSRSRFVLLEGSEVFLNPQHFGIKRIIDRPQRDPVSIAYDYEVSEGLTQEEVSVMFREVLVRLSNVGRSPWFGQFREHMLLFASKRKSCRQD